MSRPLGPHVLDAPASREGPDGVVVALDHGVVGRRAGRLVGGHGPALGHPRLAAAVEEADVGVAEQA